MILFAVAAPGFARSNLRMPVEYWDQGEATLVSGEKVAGKIFYEFDKELVLIAGGDRIMTFTSRQIRYFVIYDRKAGVERVFFSAPLQKDGQSRRYYFFEKLTDGEIALLRKPRLRQDNFGLFMSPAVEPDAGLSAFDYYYFHHGELLRIRKLKKDLVALMNRHHHKVENFIEKNGLRLNRIRDIEKIVKYYNRLCSEDTFYWTDASGASKPNTGGK